MSQRTHRRTILASLLSVFSFVILSLAALLWASGLQFNNKTGSFQQTAVIGIEDDLKAVTIRLNGEVKGTEAPLMLRNLSAGSYTVTIDRPYFHRFSKQFILEPGQAGQIKDVALIAERPAVSAVTPTPDWQNAVLFESGLVLEQGELLDQGELVSRFGETILQAHRFRRYYIYQLGTGLRFIDPASAQDYPLYTLSSAEPAPLLVDERRWELTVRDGTAAKKIQLRLSSEDAVATPQSADSPADRQ